MSSVTQIQWLCLGNVPVHVIPMETVLMEGATACLGFMVMIAVDVSSHESFPTLCHNFSILFLLQLLKNYLLSSGTI